MKKMQEVEGLFRSDQDLEKVLGVLSFSGFDRSALSILGCSSGTAQTLGLKKYKHLIDNPRVRRGIIIAPGEIGVAEGVIIGITILISLVVAFLINGSLVTNSTRITIIACLIGFFVGLIVIKLIDLAYNHYLHNQIKKGGIILWVAPQEKEQINLAREILKKCGGVHVHVRLLKDHV